MIEFKSQDIPNKGDSILKGGIDVVRFGNKVSSIYWLIRKVVLLFARLSLITLFYWLGTNRNYVLMLYCAGLFTIVAIEDISIGDKPPTIKENKEKEKE